MAQDAEKDQCRDGFTREDMLGHRTVPHRPHQGPPGNELEEAGTMAEHNP
jgi:hypothetical protein